MLYTGSGPGWFCDCLICARGASSMPDALVVQKTGTRHAGQVWFSLQGGKCDILLAKYRNMSISFYSYSLNAKKEQKTKNKYSVNNVPLHFQFKLIKTKHASKNEDHCQPGKGFCFFRNLTLLPWLKPEPSAADKGPNLSTIKEIPWCTSTRSSPTWKTKQWASK